MTATTPAARDALMTIIKAVADAMSPGIDIRWDGKEVQTPPPADGEWLKVHMRHQNSRQASLSCEHGARRWRRAGTLTVQCFAPLNGGGFTRAEELAIAFRDALEGVSTTNGVWLRDVTANEVGPDSSWYQFNTKAQFQYDEVR